MKKVFSARPIKAADAYADYDVVVSFGGYLGVEEELTVYAKVGPDAREDIMTAILDDYKYDLLEGEVVEFDADYGVYTVEVSFAGYIGVSEEFDIYADSEDEAIEQAIDDATGYITIESFKLAE